jgi:hypothetical protein
MCLIAGLYPAIEALEAALLPEKGLGLGEVRGISMEDIGWERVGLFCNIEEETACHIALIYNYAPIPLKTIDCLLPCSACNKSLKVLDVKEDGSPFKLL